MMVWRHEQSLSPRERAIAEQVAGGEALKVIAANCRLSIQAVSTYLHRAKLKLRVTSQPQLIRAMSSGAGDATAGGGAGATQSLTPAESEVLSLILRGFKNAEIAQARRSSIKTVAAHASAIMRKVGVRSRRQLITAGLGPNKWCA